MARKIVADRRCSLLEVSDTPLLKTNDIRAMLALCMTSTSTPIIENLNPYNINPKPPQRHAPLSNNFMAANNHLDALTLAEHRRHLARQRSERTTLTGLHSHDLHVELQNL